MHVDIVDWDTFIKTVSTLQYNNADIIEATKFGHKTIEDAYKDAEIPWARFYLIKDGSTVIATIMEQRDGVLIYFTTVDLYNTSIRQYIRTIRQLSDDVIECRSVLFVRVASWYLDAQRILKSAGFRKLQIFNYSQVWVKDDGK